MKENVEKDNKFNTYCITFHNSQKEKKRNLEITGGKYRFSINRL